MLVTFFFAKQVLFEEKYNFRFDDRMSFFKTMICKVLLFFSVLADWFLIVIGGLFVFKAIVAVDVPIARYFLIACGMLFSGAGLWFLFRRKKRNR